MLPTVKICGVTRAEEVAVLDDLGVAYAGLWYGIPQGKHNLSLQQLQHLSRIPVNQLKCVLVTMENNIELLAQAVEQANITGIQFHGFQLPAFIKRVRQRLGDTIKIFKVLHVRQSKCSEEDFIQRYLDAGTDVFILDSYQDQHHIGSTGVRLDDTYLSAFMNTWKINNQVMIAGGIDEHSIANIFAKHSPYGVDIDSAARIRGAISYERVYRIMHPEPTSESRVPDRAVDLEAV